MAVWTPSSCPTKPSNPSLLHLSLHQSTSFAAHEYPLIPETLYVFFFLSPGSSTKYLLFYFSTFFSAFH